jgi:VanZ family protein
MKGIFSFDKFLHFIAFAALSFAIGLWFSRESWLRLPWRNFLICLALVSAYGAIDEFHQYFVPGRSSSVWDWVADTLGGAAGAAVVLRAARFTSKYGFNRITCGN